MENNETKPVEIKEERKKNELPEFKMSIDDAISYIKARTCHIEFLYPSRDIIPHSTIEIRKGLNNKEFILEYQPGNKIKLFVETEGWKIQDAIEQFNKLIGRDSVERYISKKDLDAVRLEIKKYRKSKY